VAKISPSRAALVRGLEAWCAEVAQDRVVAGAIGVVELACASPLDA
jgi:hypothetical protein